MQRTCLQAVRGGAFPRDLGEPGLFRIATPTVAEHCSDLPALCGNVGCPLSGLMAELANQDSS